MRHNKKKVKLSRSRSQRKALIMSLCRNIFTYEKIKTTPAKAKELAKFVDKVIIWAKKGGLHQRRLIYRVVGDHKLVKHICDDIALRFKEVNSGFSRIIRWRCRKGDGAETAYIMLTKIDPARIKKDKPALVKSSSKQASPSGQKTEKAQEPVKKTVYKGIKSIFKRPKDK